MKKLKYENVVVEYDEKNGLSHVLDVVGRMLEKEQEAASMTQVMGLTDLQPLEGLMAFKTALDETFEFYTLPERPKLIDIPTGVDESTPAPWCEVGIAGLGGTLSPQLMGFPPRFGLAGIIRRDAKPMFDTLLANIKRVAREKSIYKGKAIRLNLPTEQEDYNINLHTPQFVKLPEFHEDDLILDGPTYLALDAALWVPIRYRAAATEIGVSPRRGVLLAGAPGTGKTLTATITAQLAKDHGTTFIYVTDVKQLTEALTFAKTVQPAVIFAEDIDRASMGKKGEKVQDNRSDGMNDILNAFDGVDTKGDAITVVLTTNYPDRIPKALRRPGRLDAIIELSLPTAVDAERLVRKYAREYLAADADLTEVGAALLKYPPAGIREVIERSKLVALARQHGTTPVTLTPSDIVITVDMMKRHLDSL